MTPSHRKEKRIHMMLWAILTRDCKINPAPESEIAADMALPDGGQTV